MSNEQQLSRAQLDALLKNVFALQIPVITGHGHDESDRMA